MLQSSKNSLYFSVLPTPTVTAKLSGLSANRCVTDVCGIARSVSSLRIPTRGLEIDARTSNISITTYSNTKVGDRDISVGRAPDS